MSVGRKAGTIVSNPELQLIALDRESDIDMLCAAMADGIGDGFAHQLLEVELEADRDRGLLAICGDGAIDGPLLTEALGQRAELGHGLAEFHLLVSAKGRDEAADLPLLLDQQSLELVELGADRDARFGQALDCFEAEGGTGGELDNAD